MQARIDELRQCYEVGLNLHLNLQGVVAFELSVDAVGQVMGFRFTQDKLRSPVVLRCIESRIRAWRLAPREGTGVTTFPPYLLRLENGRAMPGAELPRAEPGSAAEYVARFGACGSPWRGGYTPTSQLRERFDGSVLVDGTRAERATIAERYAYQLHTCYVRAVEVPDWKRTAGRLELRVAIDTDGRVVAARARSGKLVPELVCCVQNAALEWALPSSGAAHVLELPFLFERLGVGVRVQLAK